MTRCTRRGCGQEYDPATNTEQSCSFHPGAPVFHEGLKSWSCCSDTNKPVLDFDEFMKLPGCHEGRHSDEAPKTEVKEASKPSSAPATSLKMTANEAGKETYSSRPAAPAARSLAGPPPSTPEPEPVEEEDLGAKVPSGTKCRHYGCSIVYESDETHRVGDGPGTVCTYHPKSPIFHEGSKGYLCCKRRVLEFEEFLKIEGCTTGRHLFVPKSTGAQQTEELTECRMDHYQTPGAVHVSVFAKKADQALSTVTIEETQLHFDLRLPASKRFCKSIDLFGPVDVQASSYKYFGTKVEVTLIKKDTRSWTILERPLRDLGGVALTFGVSGRTGTIGGKELVLDADNQIRAS